MTQRLLLRIIVAAISSFVLFAALFSLPFAALPIAYIGLAYGVAQAALVAAATLLMVGIIMTPGIAIVFAILFAAPILVLIRQALLSRRLADGSFEFYPLPKLILAALAMTGLGTIFVFSLFGGAAGMPQSFADAMAASPEIKQTLGQIYNISTPADMLRVANLIIVTGFAGWPLLLLGNLQIAQALLVKFNTNLRPATDYDSLTLPLWLVGVLMACLLLASTTGGWLATLGATLAGIVLTAYFLLGLAIIHAISRPWNGRGFMLAVLYFLLFVMAWVILPVALMGLLDARFDFRGLNKNPDKPSETHGDEE